MLAIKNMEMPKSCEECPISHPVFGDGWETWCSFTKQNVATPNHNCPLVEIVTCKDCKYYRSKGDEYSYCTKRIPFASFTECREPDFYCADAERRE